MGKIIVRALTAGERTQKEKDRVRGKDRYFFHNILSWEFLHDKEVHHDWRAEVPYCFIVSIAEHRKIEEEINERDWIGKVK